MVRRLAVLGPVMMLLLTAAPDEDRTPERQGDLLVADPSDPTAGIERGDHTTPFLLRLPEGASCPGDSRNDSWRVQAFVVPSSVDLATLELTNVGPRGANESVLFSHAPPRPFVDELTAPNSGAGQPGPIAELPVLSFATRVAPVLESGSYRLVVACTFFRDIDRYWDTQWLVTSTSGAGFEWTVTGTVLPPADEPWISTTWLIRIIAIAAALAALAYLARSTLNDRRTAKKKEYSG